jgi:nitric oxide reductase large subunit
MSGSENEFTNLWELTDGLNKPKTHTKMTTIIITIIIIASLVASLVAIVVLAIKIAKDLTKVSKLLRRVNQISYFNWKGRVLRGE